MAATICSIAHYFNFRSHAEIVRVAIFVIAGGGARHDFVIAVSFAMNKLSILIPTYNHDCVMLVEAMAEQVSNLGVEAEIIVLDDGSSDMRVLAENASIEQTDHCRYIVSAVNRGIAITRNSLIDAATGDHLLFMDSDTYPVGEDFLSKYVHAADEADVVVGGMLYRRGDESVANPLRLAYGLRAECKSVRERKRRPFDAFNSSCFMISRQATSKVRFDETFDRYGHEDTLFGSALHDAGLSIAHIDAPVYHDNTDTAEQYLSKVRIAIQSLSMHADKLRGHSRLLSLYDLIDSIHMTRAVYSIFGHFRNSMERNLTGQHPLMPVLQIYKLSYLCGVMKL